MAVSDLTIPPPRTPPSRGFGERLPLAHRLRPPVHFVLAGGGAHGAVQWGLLQALGETDIAPDAVIGTSIGALGGAILAEDPASAVSRLAYVWGQLDVSTLIGEKWFDTKMLKNAGRQALVDNEPERAALEQILQARTFAELSLPFAAVSTDLATGAAVAHDSGDLIRALLASSAIPGLLPPVAINERPQVDGLASANLPCEIAVRRGAGTVIALDTGARPVPVDIASSQPKLLGRVIAVLAANQRREQLQAAAREVPVVLLPTPTDLGGTLDFRGTMQAAAASYQLAREFLAALAGERKLRIGLHARPDDPSAAGLDEAYSWPVAA